MYFLAHKDEALHTFIRHYKKIQNEKGITLVKVRNDHEGEFDNHGFESYCNEHDFGHNFLLLELPNNMRLLKGKFLFKRNGHDYAL